MIINTIEYVQNQHKITKMIHLPVSVAGQLRTTPDIFFHPATVWCPTMVCFEGCQGFSYTRRPPARFHGKSISFGQRRGTCRVSMTKSWTEKVHLFAVCRWAEKKEDTHSSRKNTSSMVFSSFRTMTCIAAICHNGIQRAAIKAPEFHQGSQLRGSGLRLFGSRQGEHGTARIVREVIQWQWGAWLKGSQTTIPNNKDWGVLKMKIWRCHWSGDELWEVWCLDLGGVQGGNLSQPASSSTEHT